MIKGEKLFKAPNGAAITCVTVDTPGVCGIYPPTPAAIGKGEPEYDGSGTKHNYDGQREFRCGGEIVWRDDEGDGWLGWMLIPEDAEPVEEELRDALVVIYELTHAIDSLTSGKEQLARIVRDNEEIGPDVFPGISAMELTIEKLTAGLEKAALAAKGALHDHLWGVEALQQAIHRACEDQPVGPDSPGKNIRIRAQPMWRVALAHNKLDERVTTCHLAEHDTDEVRFMGVLVVEDKGLEQLWKVE